jgi:uncharacterized protein with HEPN domain
MTSKADRIYLEHILECIALIQNYTCSGKVEFMASALVQDAVLRRLQTMAESTQRISEDLKAKAPEVDWRALAGFRNVLVHDYLGGIDLEQVWSAVERYLPELKTAARRLIELGEASQGLDRDH